MSLTKETCERLSASLGAAAHLAAFSPRRPEKTWLSNAYGAGTCRGVVLLEMSLLSKFLLLQVPGREPYGRRRLTGLPSRTELVGPSSGRRRWGTSLGFEKIFSQTRGFGEPLQETRIAPRYRFACQPPGDLITIEASQHAVRWAGNHNASPSAYQG